MKKISVVIPNYNMADTVGRCLEAALASDYPDFEVIVVDDGSTDNSVDIIKGFPCKLISLKTNFGTSVARNTGAKNSSGEIIFCTDSGCILRKNTLMSVYEAFNSEGANVVIGGTYTVKPYDKNFFSLFQSVFVNYSETKNLEYPDYIASHAMAVDQKVYLENDGFPEDFLPIIEDLEFSHRLRRSGQRLVMHPEIQVRHIFNFSFLRSLSNAFKKSKYWTMYSLKNKDLAADSGCASIELKFNVISFALILLLLASGQIFGMPSISYLAIPVPAINAVVSRGLLKRFYETGGSMFTALSFLYWSLLYPIPVGLGGISGAISYILRR